MRGLSGRATGLATAAAGRPTARARPCRRHCPLTSGSDLACHSTIATRAAGLKRRRVAVAAASHRPARLPRATGARLLYAPRSTAWPGPPWGPSRRYAALSDQSALTTRLPHLIPTGGGRPERRLGCRERVAPRRPRHRRQRRGAEKRRVAADRARAPVRAGATPPCRPRPLACYILSPATPPHQPSHLPHPFTRRVTMWCSSSAGRSRRT